MNNISDSIIRKPAVATLRKASLLFLFFLILVVTVGATGAPVVDFPGWQAPHIVKNITLQTEDSSFGYAVEMNDNLYFLAYGLGLYGFGIEMWRTDGTPSGTIRLEAYDDWSPSQLYVLGENIIFQADHPDFGRELWITDGSPGQAHPIGDLFPNSHDGMVEDLTVAGDYLYFAAYDEVHYDQLWRSDGTAAGTIRLTGDDKNTDAGSPQNLANLNGKLYFIISDDNYFQYLMTSDGSNAGTLSITKIGDMPINEAISEFHNVGNLLYFTIGHELWRTDGTAAGTYRLPSFPGVVDIPVMIGGDSIFYVITRNGQTSKQELWKSGGTAGTTAKVSDIPYLYSAASTAGNRLFMVCTDFDHGGELWTSDGTAAGTKLVKDIYEGDDTSYIHEIIPVGNEVYFGADESDNMRRLWRSDGTAAGTVPVPLGLPPDFNPDPEAVAEFNGRLFAQIADSAHGREPWSVDPSSGAATFLADLNELDTLSSMPRDFNIANDLLFFRADGGLWKSDGSLPGTSLVYKETYFHREIGQGPESFADIGKRLYFLINDRDNNDVEIWRTDGTAAGTMLVKDAIGSLYQMDPVRSMADVNGILYFTRFGQDRPRTELWRSDGTPGGTIYIATPFPAPFQQSSEIDEITGIGNIAYFVAANGVNGVELWRSDGTAAGTSMVKDIRHGAVGSAPSNLTAIGSHLFFFADDGIHGRELWRSDGSAAGTVMASDLKPGPVSSEPDLLTALRDTAYFVADNGTNGRELWRSDGTAAGTVIVKDILPTGSSNPRQLTTSEDWLYFFAGDSVSLNPYRTNGTAAGTTRMAIIQYNDFELPERLTAVGDWVFFLINDRLYEVHGTSGVAIAQDDAYLDFQAHHISNLTPAHDRLYFSAHHLIYGDEPFVKNLVLAENSPNILYVPEGGRTSHFRLSLKAKPQASITVHFASADPGLEISPTTHTFTPQNWNTPAVIGVRTTNSSPSGPRNVNITQSFESADSAIDGSVIELVARVGWHLGFMPYTMR